VSAIVETTLEDYSTWFDALAAQGATWRGTLDG